MMRIKKLSIVSEPPEDSRGVIRSPKGKAFIGKGELNLTCGKCDTVLAQNITLDELKNVVIYCNECGSYNNVT